MSRRPIDTKNPNPAMGHGQQAVWDQVRNLKRFTITDIFGVVDMPRPSIIACVKRLVKGGYVARDEAFATNYTYLLIKDCGRDAPRLNPDGTPSTLGRGIENMWRSMRMMNEFTPVDLAAHSTTQDVIVQLETAKKYCVMLKAAGYLRETRKPNRTKGKSAVYRLIRNTGPRALHIQKLKAVYDPNLDEVVYSEKVRP